VRGASTSDSPCTVHEEERKDTNSENSKETEDNNDGYAPVRKVGLGIRL